LGTFGATVATCKLLNLSVSEINNAIGICGALDSATPFEPFIGGAMVKDMYGGWPGFIGVFIGLLAQPGFTGLENILEAELGFFQVWTGGRFHASSILDDLGEKYIWPQGHYFKPHSACRGVHLPIDCMLEMVKVEKIEVGAIEEILVIAKPEIAYHMRGGPDPRNSIQSRVSLNYAVAAAAVFGGGHLGPEAFDDEALKNPLILELAKKVRVVSVPEPDILHIHGHGPVEIMIRFKDGSTRIGHYPDDRSLKPEDISKKFEEMALKILPPEQVTEITHIVSELESLENVRSLVKLFVG
jgi:2-methylcitrate dehydratase PrpD